MTNEQLRMQMLSGIITESEYKAKLNEYDDFDTESSSVFFDQLANKLKTFLKNEINLSDLEIDGVKIPEEETLEDAVNGMMKVLGVVMKGKAYNVGEKDVSPGYLDRFKESKETLNENFVGMGMVGNIFDREKTDYELAFEHFTKGTSLKEAEVEEGNLGHNEIASLEQEGRFWIVSWRGMNGTKEKVFTDEDEARAFMNTL